MLPSLLGGFRVAVSGAYVLRMGGSLRFQAIGLLTAIAAPFLLGSNWVFQTVTFDQVTWMVSLYWFLRLITTQRPRYWIYLGIVLGIGLEVKYTIVGLIAGICVAIVVTPSLRAALRTPHPWIGAASALLIWAPNLVWQFVEGFPSLIYIANHKGSDGGPVAYLVELGVYFFFLIPLWVAGLISLLRSPVLRPIGIACIVPLVLYLFGGKSYYAAGTIPIAVAQGLIAISRIERTKLRIGLQIAAVVAAVLEFITFFQLVVPITSPDLLHAAGLDFKNKVFADSVGGDDIANQVTTTFSALPASERENTVIISAYYGVPGALQVYDDPKVRPEAVSPQLGDYYWLPGDLTATDALMVDYLPSEVERMCASPRLVARLTVPYWSWAWSKALRSRSIRSKLRSNRSGGSYATSHDAAGLAAAYASMVVRAPLPTPVPPFGPNAMDQHIPSHDAILTCAVTRAQLRQGKRSRRVRYVVRRRAALLPCGHSLGRRRDYARPAEGPPYTWSFLQRGVHFPRAIPR